MTKYQKFLEQQHVISEEKFNNVLKSLPKIEQFSQWDLYSLDDEDEIAKNIIDDVLNEITEYAYADSANYTYKIFYLEDIISLEELEKVKEYFNNWTISNYYEIKKDIEEEKDSKEIERLLSNIKDKANLEQLREFVKTL